MKKQIEMIDAQFGRLIVIGFSHVNTHNRKKYWKVVCECGTSLIVQGVNLRNGNTKSCGCLVKEVLTARNYKHGMFGKRIYLIWNGMIQRCYNQKNKAYKNYGGRGITVCNRWGKSFENFFEDMGFRPIGKTLDRIDNDGNYEPSNCKWSTYKEQNNNTRRNKKVKLCGC